MTSTLSIKCKFSDYIIIYVFFVCSGFLIYSELSLSDIQSYTYTLGAVANSSIIPLFIVVLIYHVQRINAVGKIFFLQRDGNYASGLIAHSLMLRSFIIRGQTQICIPSFVSIITNSFP